MSYSNRLGGNNKQRGSALVEAAIVIPVLLTLVFGTIQMGYIIASYITLRNAAAAGARAGVVNAGLASATSTNADHTNYNTKISAEVTNSIIPLDAALVSYPAQPWTLVDNSVTPPRVTVRINYSLPLFPASSLVLGRVGNFDMTASVTMR